MKIAFWGGNVDASMVTRYVSAFGFYLASVRKKEVLLLQTLNSSHPRPFESVFGDGREQDVLKEELGPYMVGGMDYLTEHFQRGSLTEHRIRLASETVLYGHLQYISSLNPKEAYSAFDRILQLANEMTQLVLVDAGTGADGIGLTASNYDLVVLLVDNSTADVKKLPVDGSVSAYLLCDYRDDAFLNTGNLKRCFGLKEEKLLPICSDEAFSKAFEKGELKHFFEGRRFGFRNETDEHFLKSLSAATDKLLDLLE